MTKTSKTRIGFTGTQRGMTGEQMQTVTLLLSWGAEAFHHGDCVGADEEAFGIANSLGIPTVSHPGPDGPKRAHTPSTTILPARPYLERNRAIVHASDVMIATPSGFKELKRSGTWATVRYARKLGRPTLIVWPDGSYIADSEVKL